MTKREYFTEIRNIVTDADLVAFIDGEIAKLDAKADKTKKARTEKTAAAHTAITEGVVRVLTDAGRPITLAELTAGIGEQYTVNQVTYHLRPLVENGTVVKEKAKVDGRKIMTYMLG